MGIAPADIKKVFEPFAQSQSGRDSQEGTGLGLSICRKFVALMNGQITLENRADGITGTVVTFNMQAQRSTAQTIQQARQKTPPERDIIGLAPGQPCYKILVVDDKLANRQLLVKLLEPLGLDLKTANDGHRAVAVATQWQPDLIWMDLRMPRLNGIEATKRIRETTSKDAKTGVKIVAVSATSFVRERSDAIAAGCDAFVAKPFKATDIFNCMAQLLGLSYLYSDTLNADEQIERSPTASTSGSEPSEQSDGQKVQLDHTAMAALSPEILSELEAAVLRLNWDKILQLIETISAQDELLAKTLSQTVHHFQYAQVLEAIDTAT